MEKELYCRDIGLECDFLACGETKEETLSKLGQHVLAIHGIQGFSKEFYNKARSAIREGYCDYGDSEEMTSEDCSACYESCFDCADECCCSLLTLSVRLPNVKIQDLDLILYP